MRHAGSLAFLASTDVSQRTEWEWNRSEGQRPFRDNSGDPPARGAPLPARGLTQVARRADEGGSESWRTLPNRDVASLRRTCDSASAASLPRNGFAANGNGRSYSRLAAGAATSSSPVTQTDLRDTFASQQLGHADVSVTARTPHAGAAATSTASRSLSATAKHLIRLKLCGVSEGTRTPDLRDHNPAL